MNRIKQFSTVGATALALTMSATASFAGYMQPGESMGLSLVSPLPEGVYAGETEDYGRSNGIVPGHSVGVGVNIPVLIWSTPISFYNTRLEVIAGVPFAHVDGGGLDRLGAVSYAIGPMLAHDFGNGLTGGFAAIFRSADPSANAQDISGRTRSAGDFRQSLQYTFKGGAFDGITVMENAAWTSCFCTGSVGLTGDGFLVPTQNDLFAGDFTVEKAFGKFTLGFTGYGNIDTNNVAKIASVAPYYNPREKGIALGGLVQYDFGRFVMTGIVTRSLEKNAEVPTVSVGPETRGWLRIVVPLYVAPPAAAPVVARY